MINIKLYNHDVNDLITILSNYAESHANRHNSLDTETSILSEKLMKKIYEQQQKQLKRNSRNVKDLNQRINEYLDEVFSKKLFKADLLVDDGIVHFFSQPNKVRIALSSTYVCFRIKDTQFCKTRYLTEEEVEKVTDILLDSDKKGDEEFYELWGYLKTLTID